MTPYPANESQYWIAPVRSQPDLTSRDILSSLVGSRRVFAFSDGSRARRTIRVGDSMCFYADSGRGVVGHAVVSSNPERVPSDLIPGFPWLFNLDGAKLYLDNPVVIDKTLRRKLDAFSERTTSGQWQWFVRTVHRVSEHDFRFLTRP